MPSPEHVAQGGQQHCQDRAYGTVVTMDQTKEDKVESEGIEVQPNEIDMG